MVTTEGGCKLFEARNLLLAKGFGDGVKRWGKVGAMDGVYGKCWKSKKSKSEKNLSLPAFIAITTFTP